MTKEWNIRKFNDSDYESVCSWWEASKEPIPPRELIPDDTFILEQDGTAWICLSLLIGDIPWAWSIGLVANPDVNSDGRKTAVKELWNFVAFKAKEKGAKYLYCQAPNEKLEKRYEEVGFSVTKRNVTLMCKAI